MVSVDTLVSKVSVDTLVWKGVGRYFGIGRRESEGKTPALAETSGAQQMSWEHRALRMGTNSRRRA